jgi:hypothetical protein
MSIIVTMAAEDFAAFSTSAKHPFIVSPAQTPVPKPSSRLIRQRIITFVSEHPGSTTSEIRQGVSGDLGRIGAELRALREDGTLRAVQTAEHGTPIRHYLAIEEEEVA